MKNNVKKKINKKIVNYSLLGIFTIGTGISLWVANSTPTPQTPAVAQVSNEEKTQTPVVAQVSNEENN